MLNENEIVEGILKGKEEVLRVFYTANKSRLENYIKAKIGDENDCEEIVQDVFIAGIEGFRDFSFRCRIFTYLCSIANHKVVDYYRKKKLKKILFSQLPEMAPLISDILGPEEKLDEEILKEKIKNTFKKLAPAYGLILKLKYIYGYSVEEIAEKMSISFKSAESQLFRARKAFVLAYSI